MSSLGKLTLEIHSVNRKHLEISTYFESKLVKYELEINKRISGSVHRGKVSVRLALQAAHSGLIKVRPDLELAKELKNGWDKISSELGLSQTSEFPLLLLKDFAGLFVYEEAAIDDRLFESEIMALLDEALDDLIKMKKVEGLDLYKDVADRLLLIQKNLRMIREKALGTVEAYTTKLREKLTLLVPQISDHEDRILREICILGEKMDITEELVRFDSHVARFTEFMESGEISLGKKLEFLLQEMLREVNTIGSKSMHIEISHFVVEIKSELEKIREQLQNIE